MQFLVNNKLQLVEAATANGTDAIESDAVDMAGYDEVTFFTTIATANAGNHIQVQQGDVADGSDGTALAGTKVIAAANGDVVAVSVKRPKGRYLRAVVTRTASTVVGEIYAILSGPRIKPVDNNIDSEIVSEAHVSPAEGTA